MDSPFELALDVVVPEDSKHHIRLAGPWSIEITGKSCDDGDEVQTDKFRLNFRYGTEAEKPWPQSLKQLKSIRFSRRFNRPTGLQLDQEIFLEIHLREMEKVNDEHAFVGDVETTVSALLNGKLLGHCRLGEVNRFALTQLEPSCVLSVDFQNPGRLMAFPLPPFELVRLSI